VIKGFFLNLTILPRWVIIIIDLTIIGLSTLLGYLLRFNLEWQQVQQFDFTSGIMLSVVSGLITSLITRSYAGIVRYTGIEDGKRIAISSSVSMALLGMFNLLYYYNMGKNLIPYSVIIISFPIAFFILFFYRLFVKELFSYIKAAGDDTEKINVVIFGAGNLGLSVKQMIETSPGSGLRLMGLVEDDGSKVGKKIQGYRIYSIADLERLAKEQGVKEIIIAVNNLTPERKRQLIDQCFQLQIKVRIVPPADRWMRGELSLRQIREVNIEDLLGREVIRLRDDDVARQFRDKVVCITGAAGSIGSELCRQILQYHPRRMILVDQSETPLFEIEFELKKMKLPVDLVLSVCDISNQGRMDRLLGEEKPEVIFHAAAYKHVPLMESNPAEAVICNVLGTRIVADLAVKYGARKFIMVSTDKAVRPTSIMGCTKRIAEMYIQSLHQLRLEGRISTSFVTTRFGNVLGSNGSVIPVFRKQIEAGGPITVTHPEIVRYFMTIPEASRLVLEAGIMGEGGEIFIFDMGKPVKIYDLARQMIKLSGLELNKDIEIVFTGLRDGEKLFEELLNDSENTIPTHHQKILKAKVSEIRYEKINSYIDLLEDLIKDKNELKVVALMKDIVPEYKSNYSRFEILD
jgi:FlaA1/EpsC-like NDP-sugar epimerase